jgi:hypothetical protein
MEIYVDLGDEFHPELVEGSLHAAKVKGLGGLVELEIHVVKGLFASRRTSHCLVESKTSC